MASPNARSMSIQTYNQIEMGQRIEYTQDWNTMIESHLSWLLQDANYQTFTVTPNDAYRFEGDLLSLIVAQNLSPSLLYPIMRMNNLRSPSQYRADMITLKMPYPQTITSLRELFQTSAGKTT